MTNRHRRALESTTAAFTGLLDESGNPIPARRINIRELPEIDRAALSGLPDDMEARLLQDGGIPAIILFHPASELYMEIPVAAHENITPYVEALNVARLKQAMGEAPEIDGYRSRNPDL